MALAAGNPARLSELEFALHTLAAAGIPAAVAATPDAVMMLAGVQPYPLTEARVLVSPRDLVRAGDTLMGVELEHVAVESSVATAPFGGRFQMDEALNRAVDVPVGAVSLRALAPRDRLIALCARGASKQWPRDYVEAAAALRRECDPAIAVHGPRKLLLRQIQSPGDVVMLTAAVRDLHLHHPGSFVTDVRTPCPDLWAHNPYVSRLDDDDPDAEVIDCEYPVIHQSNQRPVHFLHGFVEFFNERLGLQMAPTAFKGDVHLSSGELERPSLVQEITGQDFPYWIVAAGGKYDFTIKWWSLERYQAVVDHFRGRLLFVQIGESGHHHGALEGAIDLRGRTTLRDLIRLVHHAAGVITPVSLLMHLAAAIGPRPCVVIAGGREPAHWETYPGHQFLHTIGALPCCESGGCWRSRTLPLLDGDAKDGPDQLCVDVVDGLPHCMDMITADEAINRVELYLRGGGATPLSAEEGRRAASLTLAPAPLAEVDAYQVPVWYFAGPLPQPSGGRSESPARGVIVRGEDVGAAKERIEGIGAGPGRESSTVVVGAIAVSDAVREYLYLARRAGDIDRIHESPSDIDPGMMMERVTRDLGRDIRWQSSGFTSTQS